MNLYKSLREIDDDLPNGFHDAHLEAVTVSFASNSAKMDLQLFVGDPDAVVRGKGFRIENSAASSFDEPQGSGANF